MKTLYLDCGMGAAGDMLTAALAELLPDPDAFFAKLNALGIPGVEYIREPSVKCGITGTHVTVKVDGQEEASSDADPHGHDHEHHHDHDHHHEHDHGHAHRHSGLSDIEHIVRDHLDLPEKVRDDVLAVFGLIAEAESHVHGVKIDEIHFHEVGTMDAVADVTAVCLAMAALSPDEVVVSPVHVGSGHVSCAHGILPVPAPATAYILRDVPIYGGAIRGELCTPTGAALLKHFADRFGDMPVMRTEKIGYGMGKKDFEAANCVRALLGEREERSSDAVLLACNLDDMTPEAVGFAMETLLAEGALDVWTTPVGMKKNRPGILLSVLCRPEDREATVRRLFRHTS
ncbi:MAG: nickel pincer cofactor biosynthesis protein LarC, partial [Clostridia bacterium]|nr:nickel pincer cofactor biosynthesis protein LarC [Clostridia bacterium]